MIYRIDANSDKYYWIDFSLEDSQSQPLDLGLPFAVSPIEQVYGDKWKSMYVDFREHDKEDIEGAFPDISVQRQTLFLSVKGYNCLHQILAPHGEFLPITYEEGDGYLFNPSAMVDPVVDSIVFSEKDCTLVTQCDFPEDSPLIFVGEVQGHYLYIREEVYKAIEDCNLKGLYVYPDQYTVFNKPIGGFIGKQGL